MALNVKSTGIEFTPQGGSSVNLLDDYEEGTFTPVMKGGTTDGSNSSQAGTGTYIKTGRQCHIQIAMSNKTISSETGFLKISGLPFTSFGNDIGGNPCARLHDFTWTSDSLPAFYVTSSNTYLVGLEASRGGDWANWAVTNASTLYLGFTTDYITT